MSSVKNLNECNGCLIIDNDQNIALPAVNKINAYDIDFEKPCFFINNHFISPLLRCYSVTLPNPVSLEKCDKLRIRIKIPKNIFGQKYGYTLDDFTKELQNQGSKFIAGLRLKSSDGCLDIKRDSTDPKQLQIQDYCGWIIITIHYQVENPEQICNLCEIAYSICFDPVKVKALYGQCDDHTAENVAFPIETCLELENVAARREVKVSGGTGWTVQGPENFLCLVVDNDTSIVASFDKFTKTLTVPNGWTPTNVNNIDFSTGSLNTVNVPGTYQTKYADCI